jgi:hypothetical protein
MTRTSAKETHVHDPLILHRSRNPSPSSAEATVNGCDSHPASPKRDEKTRTRQCWPGNQPRLTAGMWTRAVREPGTVERWAVSGRDAYRSRSASTPGLRREVQAGTALTTSGRRPSIDIVHGDVEDDDHEEGEDERRVEVESADEEGEPDVVADLEGLVVPSPDRAERHEHHQVEAEVRDPGVDVDPVETRTRVSVHARQIQTTVHDGPASGSEDSPSLHLRGEGSISSEHDHVRDHMHRHDQPEQATHPSMEPVDRSVPLL